MSPLGRGLCAERGGDLARKGRESAVAPLVRGGSCAEPRSDPARSAAQLGPRRPARVAWLGVTRDRPSVRDRCAAAPAPEHTVARVRLGWLLASLRRHRPLHLRRTLRIEPGCRSCRVGPGLSATPSAAQRHDCTFLAPTEPGEKVVCTEDEVSGQAPVGTLKP